MLSWQSRIEPIQKTERHEQHGSLMAEPAIHDGDLAFDADASSCAILHCTPAFSLLLLHAKLGNPCNWRLALAWCLINSTLVKQKAPDLPKHLAWLPKAYLKQHDHCVHLKVEQGHWLAQEQNSQSGGPGHPRLKASWPCVAIKPCLQHVPNWGWTVTFTLNVPNMHHADGKCTWHVNVAQGLALWVVSCSPDWCATWL